MGFFVGVWNIIIVFFLFIWNEFLAWLSIFIGPLKNLEMLWIIVPIWVNWFFTEFFQEKEGTSMGNAVTNGGVMAWVGVDWIRYMVRMINIKELNLVFMTYVKFFLSLLVILIGIFIIVQGVKVKKYIHFLGRVRETSYVLLMISPIIYGVIDPTWKNVLAIIIFAPLFYYIIELIDKYTPDPDTYEDNKSKDVESDIFPKKNNENPFNDPFNNIK